MHEIFTELSENAPHFAILVVGPLLFLCAQVLLLRTAFRRRRACLDLEDRIESEGWPSVAQSETPSWWPVLLAEMSALAIPALGLWSVSTARDRMLAAITIAPPAEKAEQISRSLSGMFNAIPWTICLFLPSAVMAIVSGTMILAARARIRRLIGVALRPLPDGSAVSPSSVRGPGSDNLTVLPALLFVGVLIPVILGAWHDALEMIQGLSSLARVPVAEKVQHLVDAVERSHATFVEHAWLRWPGAVAATLVGGVLLVVWGRTWPWRPSWRRTLLISQSCVVGAVCLFIAAGPFRAENRMPWPPPAPGNEKLLVDEPKSPMLEGPDEIERAPILWLNDRQHLLDGYRTNSEDLEDQLRTRKQTYRILNPAGEWAGRLLVLSVADLPIPTLIAYLTAAARADHRQPLFIFTKRETLVRPILGKLSRVHATGVAVTLVNSDAVADTDQDSVVNPRTFSSYGALVRHLVELRSAGQTVALQID